MLQRALSMIETLASAKVQCVYSVYRPRCHMTCQIKRPANYFAFLYLIAILLDYACGWSALNLWSTALNFYISLSFGQVHQEKKLDIFIPFISPKLRSKLM